MGGSEGSSARILPETRSSQTSGPGRTAMRSATARHTHHRAVPGVGVLTAPGRRGLFL